jgi:hypothetical protein
VNLGPIVYEGVSSKSATNESLPVVSSSSSFSNPFAGKGRLTQYRRPPGR